MWSLSGVLVFFAVFEIALSLSIREAPEVHSCTPPELPKLLHLDFPATNPVKAVFQLRANDNEFHGVTWFVEKDGNGIWVPIKIHFSIATGITKGFASNIPIDMTLKPLGDKKYETTLTLKSNSYKAVLFTIRVFNGCTAVIFSTEVQSERFDWQTPVTPYTEEPLISTPPGLIILDEEDTRHTLEAKVKTSLNEDGDLVNEVIDWLSYPMGGRSTNDRRDANKYGKSKVTVKNNEIRTVYKMNKITSDSQGTYCTAATLKEYELAADFCSTIVLKDGNYVRPRGTKLLKESSCSQPDYSAINGKILVDDSGIDCISCTGTGWPESHISLYDADDNLIAEAEPERGLLMTTLNYVVKSKEVAGKTFKCKARFGNIVTGSTFTPQLHKPLKLEGDKKGIKQYVSLKDITDKISVTCKAIGNPKPKISFYFAQKQFYNHFSAQAMGRNKIPDNLIPVGDYVKVEDADVTGVSSAKRLTMTRNNVKKFLKDHNTKMFRVVCVGENENEGRIKTVYVVGRKK